MEAALIRVERKAVGEFESRAGLGAVEDDEGAVSGE